MNRIKALIVCLITAALVAGAATVTGAETAPERGAVASAHPLATQAGMRVLAEGGNAFDAAVAVTAALSVVEPFSSGLGGGGFYLLHRAEDGFEVMIDARETAPLASTRDMFLDDTGDPVPERSREGPLAAGIPGIPAALEHLAREYGNRGLEDSLVPAIEYAREGFAVTERYRKLAGWRRSLLQKYPVAAGVFLVDGKVPDAGYTLRQADLAETLERIAAEGADGFYAGEIAGMLVDGVNDAGGIWSEKDLAEYEIIESEPVRGRYHDMRVVSAALPSSGGIVLVTALNILEQYDLASLNRTERVHLIVEAMRRAYRDRAEYLGDPAFVDVPVERLTHPFYAAGLAATIRRDKATPSTLLPGAVDVSEGGDTTHFSIIDKDGNRVSATLSINFPFGSGVMPPGTGVILNNEMDDFAAKAGVPNGYGLVASGDNPNAVAPGKRMLSSMTPTFLETGERLALIGTPGGSRIISMVLLGSLAFYKGADAEAIVSQPRFHHQFLPDRISYEPDSFAKNTRLGLQLRGHHLDEMNRRYGNMQVVIWDKTKNRLNAASDPRGEGVSRVGE